MNLENWKTLITSTIAGDRAHAADELPKMSKESEAEVIEMLLECLNDQDALVRTCAADSLGFFQTAKVHDALQKSVLTEIDELARAFALSSLGEQGKIEDVTTILDILKENHDPQVQIHGMCGLFNCVQLHTSNNLLDFLNNEDDRVRISAVNSLLDIFFSHESVRETAVPRILEAKSHEKNPAVTEVFSEILEKISPKS